MKNSVRYPEGQVLLRHLNMEFPVISHGKGVYLYDRSGKQYLDASGGAMVVSMGHGQKEIVDEMAQHLQSAAYVNGLQFTSPVVEELATRLIHYGKKINLEKVSFLCSGSEVVEAAVKFARQIWKERGQEKKSKLIVRVPSYHGNTLYALSASGRPSYKKLFGPLLSEMLIIPTPLTYRGGDAGMAEELEGIIRQEGADTISAFLYEPIPASSAGAAVPPPGYLDRITEICQKHQILMIADEIVTGMGRTGTFFATESVGGKPDLLVMAKGIGSGYAPISALLVKKALVDEMQQAPLGKFMHAQTFMNVPCTAAAGLAVMNFFEKQDVLKNVSKVGVLLLKELKECIGHHPHVGNIDGRGLLYGIEFVADKKSKEPFPRKQMKVEKVVSSLLQQGIIVWPNSGHVDGEKGDLIMISPPLTIRENEIKDLGQRLQKGLKEALS